MRHRIRPATLMVITTILAAGITPSAWAGLRTTVTKGDGFTPSALGKVAVVTAECHEVVDCSAIERRVFVEALNMKLDLQIVPEALIRQFLFANGQTEYSTELRGTLAKEFELDGLIELKIPSAEKGDGYAGIRGSRAKVELVVVDPEGRILLHGVGTGRPRNVVTSPERVAGNVVEDILRKAFK